MSIWMESLLELCLIEGGILHGQQHNARVVPASYSNVAVTSGAPGSRRAVNSLVHHELAMLGMIFRLSLVYPQIDTQPSHQARQPNVSGISQEICPYPKTDIEAPILPPA